MSGIPTTKKPKKALPSTDTVLVRGFWDAYHNVYTTPLNRWLDLHMASNERSFETQRLKDEGHVRCKRREIRDKERLLATWKAQTCHG
ncbi:BQ5605_C004g02900 [Microbotryum silenes-dioicae]|uniref:BQ5605_C004g02900 protein n=1 Tax=Microbotryum silenes-dioicae TaxID=796604 RepID=A0A2X0M953_9BASI|nr:BQ5605_C004g02900 [Microbotryum silenes-dioicae]